MIEWVNALLSHCGCLGSYCYCVVLPVRCVLLHYGCQGSHCYWVVNSVWGTCCWQGNSFENLSGLHSLWSIGWGPRKCCALSARAVACVCVCVGGVCARAHMRVHMYIWVCMRMCMGARVCLQFQADVGRTYTLTCSHVLLLISTATATVWQLWCVIHVCKTAVYVLAHLN